MLPSRFDSGSTGSFDQKAQPDDFLAVFPSCPSFIDPEVPFLCPRSSAVMVLRTDLPEAEPFLSLKFSIWVLFAASIEGRESCALLHVQNHDLESADLLRICSVSWLIVPLVS